MSMKEEDQLSWSFIIALIDQKLKTAFEIDKVESFFLGNDPFSFLLAK